LLIITGILFVKDMRIFPEHTKAVAAAPVAHEAGLEDEAVSSGLINGGRGTILRYAGWIGVFSTYIVLGLTNNIFPLFIRDTLGFGESIAGNILFVRGLTTAAGFYLAGRIIGWHFNGKVMIITQTATAAAMLFLLFIKTVPGFYILFIFYGLLFSMAYANAIFHGSAGALDRGRRMGLFESFLTMGVITGSIGGGYLFQYFSIYAAFVFCFIIITAGLAAQLIILREGKKRGLR
jgi:predicted MFS family arabinose efflux permease